MGPDASKALQKTKAAHFDLELFDRLQGFNLFDLPIGAVVPACVAGRGHEDSTAFFFSWKGAVYW